MRKSGRVQNDNSGEFLDMIDITINRYHSISLELMAWIDLFLGKGSVSILN